jgi:hypothetical protein
MVRSTPGVSAVHCTARLPSSGNSPKLSAPRLILIDGQNVAENAAALDLVRSEVWPDALLVIIANDARQLRQARTLGADAILISPFSLNSLQATLTGLIFASAKAARSG